MKLVINPNEHGFKNTKYDNQVGLDIAIPTTCTLRPNEHRAINLKTQVQIPPGHQGYIVPRSSWAKKGLSITPVPIDPGYNGDIHAFVTCGNYTTIETGTYFCQLVITPVASVTPVAEIMLRDDRAFGSTDKSGV